MSGNSASWQTYPVSTINQCVAWRAYFLDDLTEPIYVLPGDRDRRVERAEKVTLWWSFDIAHEDGKETFLVPMSNPFNALTDCLGSFLGESARLLDHEEVAKNQVYRARIDISGIRVIGSGDHVFRAVIAAFLRYEQESMGVMCN